MGDPLQVTVTGDASDVFREQYNIQSLQQARDAANNLDTLWNTPNPWNDGTSDRRDIFDEAAQGVVNRFESGRYQPEAKAQPSDHFSPSNKIAARQNGSFKAVSNTPDVCKTPAGSATPPVPYQITADLGSSAGVVPNVRFNGNPAYVLDQSTVPTCTGDEPGTADGVKSGTVGGVVKPTGASSTVRAGGHQIVRDGDSCTMNSGNCTGTYVTAPAPGSSVDASGNVVGDANPPPDKGALHQVGGFFKGAGGALWDMGKGIVGLGVGAAKLSVVSQAAEELSNATGLYSYHGYSDTQAAVGKTAQAIYDHPGAIIDGITKPYSEAWARGDYGEALGRGTIDIGSMIIPGVGEAGKVGDGANALGKVGDVANVAEKTGDIADAASQAGKATAKGTDVAEGATDASKAADAKPAGDGVKAEPRFRGTIKWRTAKDANEELIDRGIASADHPPFKDGTMVTDRQLAVGERYNMLVDEDQLKQLQDPLSTKGLGGWGSSETFESQSQGLDRLGVSSGPGGFKPKGVQYQIELEANQPIHVLEGTAGPQGDLGGGGQQVFFDTPPPTRRSALTVTKVNPLPGP